MDLSRLQEQLKGQSPKAAPVHLWNPPFCGNIDIVIKQDGSWCYNGTPITRNALVTLFSSVLKHENEQYYLVTPIEKVGIQVEDVPFIITHWRFELDNLLLTTKEGIEFIVGEEHPVELRYHQQHQTHLPYVKVRDNLFARFHQNVFYQLVELGRIETDEKGMSHLMVKSGNYSFSLGQID
ncbi:DUF1285 domain-containing protein [Alteromonas sp. a30]|uniref:DUF1285 domain-containing protein n=1 Tax=Alteromonas sp. a30 TaxID=2730917 RepID=UPI002282D2EC|nr:DUF1285 domain-containing protein [Alteromonas sp. a30]MCY7294848.1 DUF1285 domain-containing protein [Alteromonas sp. a30]